MRLGEGYGKIKYRGGKLYKDGVVTFAYLIY